MMRISWDMPQRHPWAVRIGLALAFAVVLGYGPHRAVGGAGARIETLSSQLGETRESIIAIERENEELRARVHSLKNDREAIEEIARRDLGLVRPGEVVVDLRGGLGEADAEAAKTR